MGRDGRPTRTFGGVLRRGMLVGGERSAVVCGDVRLTHRELADRTRRLGDALARESASCPATASPCSAPTATATSSSTSGCRPPGS